MECSQHHHWPLEAHGVAQDAQLPHHRSQPDNRADVEDVGPDHVADGEARVALECGPHGDHELGRRSTGSDDGQADHGGRDAREQGDPASTTHERLGTPDQQGETCGDQQSVDDHSRQDGRVALEILVWTPSAQVRSCTQSGTNRSGRW